MRLICLPLLLLATAASAVPLLTGSAVELGAYDLAAALELKDDGRGPDLQPGDFIFTVTVGIAAPGTVRYKVVPDTLGPIGTADGDWMQFELAGVGPFQVTFVYDDRPSAGLPTRGTIISVDYRTGLVTTTAPASPCYLQAKVTSGFQPGSGMWDELPTSNLVALTVIPKAKSGGGCGTSAATAASIWLLLLLFRRARRA